MFEPCGANRSANANANATDVHPSGRKTSELLLEATGGKVGGATAGEGRYVLANGYCYIFDAAKAVT